MENFIKVSESAWNTMLSWYSQENGKYHWHPIPPADRVNVYDDKNCKLLIAYKTLYMENEFFINKNIFLKEFINHDKNC
jgi:hypothetical protein